MLFLLLGVTGCDDDDVVIPNEEELITTLTYSLIPVNGGEEVLFHFRDLDGDGGNPPVITNDTLMANTIYNGTLEVLDETGTPAENITTEIAQEDEEHQFFYSLNAGLGGSISYNDSDGNNNPVGLETEYSTGNAGSGNLIITLRHEPDKNAAGVSDGDITNAGGETDIEVTFTVVVQ